VSNSINLLECENLEVTNAGNRISFRRDHISTWWQVKNGKLNIDQIQRLESDPLIEKILQHDPLIIWEAIFEKGLIKLNEILSYAQKYTSHDLTKKLMTSSDTTEPASIRYRISKQYFPTTLEPMGEYRSAKDEFVSPLNSNYQSPKQIDLTHTSKYVCQICNQPVVGNECGCRLTS
jgi:hypothetical protein